MSPIADLTAQLGKNYAARKYEDTGEAAGGRRQYFVDRLQNVVRLSIKALIPGGTSGIDTRCLIKDRIVQQDVQYVVIPNRDSFVRTASIGFVIVGTPVSSVASLDLPGSRRGSVL
jgi:hypothetical protein